MIVIDSINGLIPKALADAYSKGGSESQNQPGRRAAMMANYLESVTGRAMLGTNQTAMLLTAHQHVNIGGVSKYGPPLTMSGGETLKYLAKIIVVLKKDGIATVKDKNGWEQAVGHTVRYTLSKNHVTGFQRIGSYSLKHMVGIDDTDAVWNLAKDDEFGIITTKRVDKKSVVVFNVLPEVIEFTGKLADAQKFHKENPELHQKLKDRISALKGVKKKDRAQFLLDTTPNVTIVGTLAAEVVSEVVPDVDSEEGSDLSGSEE